MTEEWILFHLKAVYFKWNMHSKPSKYVFVLNDSKIDAFQDEQLERPSHAAIFDNNFNFSIYFYCMLLISLAWLHRFGCEDQTRRYFGSRKTRYQHLVGAEFDWKNIGGWCSFGLCHVRPHTRLSYHDWPYACWSTGTCCANLSTSHYLLDALSDDTPLRTILIRNVIESPIYVRRTN